MYYIDTQASNVSLLFQPSGHIVFQHGVHTEPIGNSCWFDARRQETKQTRIILKIEKSKLLEQCDQMSWKPLIDLEVYIPPLKPVSEPETPVNETFDGRSTSIAKWLNSIVHNYRFPLMKLALSSSGSVLLVTIIKYVKTSKQK